MKKDEWILSKELGRIRKYGIHFQAQRANETQAENQAELRYDIVTEKTREVIVPYCTIEEIMSVTLALEKVMERLKGSGQIEKKT